MDVSAITKRSFNRRRKTLSMALILFISILLLWQLSKHKYRVEIRDWMKGLNLTPASTTRPGAMEVLITSEAVTPILSTTRSSSKPFYYITSLNLSCPPDANEKKLSKLHKKNREKGPLIPRIIHQSWKNKELPKRFEKWQKSWKVCFPDWEFKFWTDADNRQFVQKHYAWFLPIYDSYKDNIQRVDAVRSFYLYHYGGLYVDLDYECIKPFEHLLVKDLVFESMQAIGGGRNYPENPYIQNSFMASRARHPFWEMFWQNLVRRKDEDRAESSTGPHVLMTTLEKYTIDHEDYMVYPPCYFNPFSWYDDRTSGCKTLNRMKEKEVQKCRDHFPSAFTVTFHTQSWRDGKENVYATD